MRKSLKNFGRTFQLWTYSVSHSQLLFWSTKDVGRYETRIEVLFTGVVALEAAASIQQFEVEEQNVESFLLERPQLHGSAFRRARVYRLRGTDHDGYVVAEGAYWNEDGAEFSDPSRLMDPWRWPGSVDAKDIHATKLG
jgi:hypothetical protein